MITPTPEGGHFYFTQTPDFSTSTEQLAACPVRRGEVSGIDEPRPEHRPRR